MTAIKAKKGVDLRTNLDGLSRVVVDKSQHSAKTVSSYQYTPKAVAMIREELASGGHLRLLDGGDPTDPS